MESTIPSSLSHQKPPMSERRALLSTDIDTLPVWGRVLLRVLFREGPITVAMLVMLGVILGLIPSPYLGKPLQDIIQVHKEQTVVLEDIRDELKAWKNDSPTRRTR